jgi:hypothetical protein
MSQAERDLRFNRAWAQHQEVAKALEGPRFDGPPKDQAELIERARARAAWLAKPRRRAQRRAVESPSGGFVMLLRWIDSRPL